MYVSKASPLRRRLRSRQASDPVQIAKPRIEESIGILAAYDLRTESSKSGGPERISLRRAIFALLRPRPVNRSTPNTPGNLPLSGASGLAESMARMGTGGGSATGFEPSLVTLGQTYKVKRTERVCDMLFRKRVRLYRLRSNLCVQVVRIRPCSMVIGLACDIKRFIQQWRTLVLVPAGFIDFCQVDQESGLP